MRWTASRPPPTSGPFTHNWWMWSPRPTSSPTSPRAPAKRVPGNLRFDVDGNPTVGVGGYEIVGRRRRQTQIPLIPTRRLLRDFMPLKMICWNVLPGGGVDNGGRSPLPVRGSTSFIDALSDFLWHDDRGRAFGMWRWLPDWRRDDTPVYRFDYSVEANPLKVSNASRPTR